MDIAKPQHDWTLGFLSVRHHPNCGYFGGFLVVNALARPLEFHCTLPLQPTRAQQILYGATLEEFVCGEQIGRILVQRAKSKPDAILSDNRSALSLRHVERVPIASIDAGSSRTANAPTLRHPSSTREDLIEFRLSDYTLCVLPEHESDCDPIESLFQKISHKFDLLEPFARIEDALMEANPVARAA